MSELGEYYQMIFLRENYWAYPLPESAEGAEIRGEHSGRPYQLLSFYGEADAVDLPPGTWQIVCTSKNATYLQAASIVEHFRGGFVDYDENSIPRVYAYTSPFESLNSLLTSKECDLNINWLILKKQ
jgi:hypothetical protein